MTSPGADFKNKSEIELILLAKTNRAAFGELYDRHVDRVYTYVYYRTGSRTQTEDIVSATFLKALEHISSFKPKQGGFTAWLLRISRNLLVDSYRKDRRLSLSEIPDMQPDPGATPEEAAMSDADTAVLRELIATLPSLQKETIMLKYTFDLKNKEIAAVLGKSETAVSSLVHRALQSLRTEVKNHGL